jgi:hypothetical protein
MIAARDRNTLVLVRCGPHAKLGAAGYRL